MTIDGESYDPFSAETLKVLPPTHPSYRERILDASRQKFAGHIDEVKQAILEEESSIVRSASEKAAINHEAKHQDEEENQSELNNLESEIQAPVAEAKESSPLI